jgi:hypothetical protein
VKLLEQIGLWLGGLTLILVVVCGVLYTLAICLIKLMP